MALLTGMDWDDAPLPAEQPAELLTEAGRWRAREVTYWSGTWDRISRLLPRFQTQDFRAGPDEPSNPHLRSVVRLPLTAAERPIPVGVVSNTYMLAQHGDVAEKCLDGIRALQIETATLRCEVGLTQLGEWMHLRIYFPEEYNHTPRDGETIALRLECFNSVDGSSRLVILLGWLRFICSNGMVVGETKTELRNIHNARLDIARIPELIACALKEVEADIARLQAWEKCAVESSSVRSWADHDLATAWGKKAACRVYHVCASGHDVEITDPFASGEATDKPVKQLAAVPGATSPARSLFDVSQALSWVAGRRSDPEERVERQSSIPDLINALHTAG